MARTGRLVAGALALAATVLVARFFGRWAAVDDVACGPGFFSVGARCCPGPRAEGGRCLEPAACPPPLIPRGRGCDAPDVRVLIAETSIQVGSSDWEAEGRVAARTVRAGPFAIDAFETTRGHFSGDTSGDAARAASGMTRRAASDYCARTGGRLPSEDEWLVAAAGPGARRYPWGDTGAVCRRAAFGLARGPCATVGVGPDTVGAHPAGDAPTGIHDLAGNVAEWVAPGAVEPELGVARGGSWQSSLATDLRTWARLELDPERADDRVGVRCVHDVR